MPLRVKCGAGAQKKACAELSECVRADILPGSWRFLKRWVIAINKQSVGIDEIPIFRYSSHIGFFGFLVPMSRPWRKSGSRLSLDETSGLNGGSLIKSIQIEQLAVPSPDDQHSWCRDPDSRPARRRGSMVIVTKCPFKPQSWVPSSMVEQRPFKPWVLGSSPREPTKS